MPQHGADKFAKIATKIIDSWIDAVVGFHVKHIYWKYLEEYVY